MRTQGVLIAFFAVALMLALTGCPKQGTPDVVPPTCAQDWTCGEWDDCSTSGTQTRTCTDLNNCGNISRRPILTQSCTYVPPALEIHQVLDDKTQYLGQEVTVKGRLSDYMPGGYNIGNASIHYQLEQSYEDEWGGHSASVLVLMDPKDNHQSEQEYYATGTFNEYAVGYCSCVQYMGQTQIGSPYNKTVNQCAYESNEYYCTDNSGYDCDTNTCYCACIPGTTQNITENYYLDLTGHPLQPA